MAEPVPAGSATQCEAGECDGALDRQTEIEAMHDPFNLPLGALVYISPQR